MSKENSKNPFHMLKKKSPRAWAIVTFPLFLITTLVLVPLVYVYEIIVDIPRVAGNLWEDIKSMFRNNNNEFKRIVPAAWKSLYKAFVLNKDINRDESRSKNDNQRQN